MDIKNILFAVEMGASQKATEELLIFSKDKPLSMNHGVKLICFCEFIIAFPSILYKK